MSKHLGDTSTIDMIGGIPCKRGRPLTASSPRTVEEKKAAAAARKAKSRALKASTHGTLTVELPLDVLEQFRAFLKFKDLTQEVVLEKLLRTQLLRKR